MRAGWLGRLNELQITSVENIPADLFLEAVPPSIREAQMESTASSTVEMVR